jgi:3-phenylpropionate/trans-cinnamate dioxygenase ferredoxin subunit
MSKPIKKEQNMETVRVASTTDVPAGKMKKVNVGGRDILLANINGEYWAINNKCPHLGGSLADGKLEGGAVTCPRHGARFDLKTGEAIGKAKIGPLKITPKNAECYEVNVEGTELIVKIP